MDKLKLKHKSFNYRLLDKCVLIEHEGSRYLKTYYEPIISYEPQSGVQLAGLINGDSSSSKEYFFQKNIDPEVAINALKSVGHKYEDNWFAIINENNITKVCPVTNQMGLSAGIKNQVKDSISLIKTLNLYATNSPIENRNELLNFQSLEVNELLLRMAEIIDAYGKFIPAGLEGSTVETAWLSLGQKLNINPINLKILNKINEEIDFISIKGTDSARNKVCTWLKWLNSNEEKNLHSIDKYVLDDIKKIISSHYISTSEIDTISSLPKLFFADQSRKPTIKKCLKKKGILDDVFKGELTMTKLMAAKKIGHSIIELRSADFPDVCFQYDQVDNEFGIDHPIYKGESVRVEAIVKFNLPMRGERRVLLKEMKVRNTFEQQLSIFG
ncbi:hypothetical protein [Photobacterium leiognathi]|uniref:hypothetical protein n=1 Tax=Photobacterium leiognathi TaxID=553611 RepID=UPI00298237B4|nr:hypothetical protein [Photobacterium leiognathi]